MQKRLIIVSGPTAVGKTAYAIGLAKQYGTEIVGCDSRQFYSEMCIGVARPSVAELAATKHHFVACRSAQSPYNIFDYEHDAMQVLADIFTRADVAIACGGSGLYIDALISQPAHLPDPSPQLRQRLQQMPLEEKQQMLAQLDADYYAVVDRRNPVRLQRALEVCITAGRSYSSIVAQQHQQPRPFAIEMHTLCAERTTLRSRIDARVDAMLAEGLVEEVASLTHLRHLNTLRTVGYTELFAYLDGHITLAEATQQIKLHTWQYARKQLTWLKRYKQTLGPKMHQIAVL